MYRNTTHLLLAAHNIKKTHRYTDCISLYLNLIKNTLQI